jgi:hypothetical protein
MPPELCQYSDKIKEPFVWNGKRWAMASDPYKFWKTPEECARLNAEAPQISEGARKTLAEIGQEEGAVHWNGRTWAFGDECMGQYGDDKALEDLGHTAQSGDRAIVRRKLIVWAWVVGVAALGLYPPWVSRNETHLGYRWIFAPPRSFCHVDLSILTLEWIGLTIVAAGLFFVWPFRTKGKQPI